MSEKNTSAKASISPSAMPERVPFQLGHVYSRGPTRGHLGMFLCNDRSCFAGAAFVNGRGGSVRDRHVADMEFPGGVWRAVQETPRGLHFVLLDDRQPVYGVWFIARDDVRPCVIVDAPNGG
jgi:hypothetical protein